MDLSVSKVEMAGARAFLCFLFFLIFLLHGCSKRVEPPYFAMKNQGKGLECADFWLNMEQILDGARVRCGDLERLEGFPFLRVNGPLKKAVSMAQSREQLSRGLDLMQRADLAARYREIERLDDNDFLRLCKVAGLQYCSTGSIRARVARCSGLITGEQKLGGDIAQYLLPALKQARRPVGTSGDPCFQDKVTLDSALPADLEQVVLTGRTTGKKSFRGLKRFDGGGQLKRPGLRKTLPLPLERE